MLPARSWLWGAGSSDGLGPGHLGKSRKPRRQLGSRPTSAEGLTCAGLSCARGSSPKLHACECVIVYPYIRAALARSRVATRMALALVPI